MCLALRQCFVPVSPSFPSVLGPVSVVALCRLRASAYLFLTPRLSLPHSNSLRRNASPLSASSQQHWHHRFDDRFHALSETVTFSGDDSPYIPFNRGNDHYRSPMMEGLGAEISTTLSRKDTLKSLPLRAAP
ncbi:hypothetical protein PIB30_104704 [Stylosanthes scabra]|uniref:Uncharacterized protein n=1 Tax=Stylosanthes scabra TaxID=79078 RepID=A0ABU6WY96_9FABA|nr:hypothetical protein [Stylosanthes scabra]